MKYKNEILNRFLAEKVAIALRTQEEYNMFMELLEKESDLRWSNGKKPAEFDGWNILKKDTQIGIEKGFIIYGMNYFIVNGYEIIRFKELIKEKETNLADKLRFLADRWEDGKTIVLVEGDDYYFKDNQLYSDITKKPTGICLNTFLSYNFKLKPQWTFTENEKVILRNLSKEYKWITRDKDGEVIIYKNKPSKSSNAWFGGADYVMLYMFRLEFETIKWLDEEPCEFRKYL